MESHLSDLLPVLQELELVFAQLYGDVAVIEGEHNPRLRTAAQVLGRQEKEHARAFEARIAAIHAQDDPVVPAGRIESARSLLAAFRKEVRYRAVGNVDMLVEMAMRFERNYAALLLRLAGEIGQEADPEAVALLLELAGIEREHAAVLQAFQTERASSAV